MAAIALFVLAAEPETTAVASLHKDCVDIFIRCVNSPDANVSLFVAVMLVTTFGCPLFSSSRFDYPKIVELFFTVTYIIIFIGVLCRYRCS